MPRQQWIVVVEPSMFRVAETYVLGPFGEIEAKEVQRQETAAHPFCQTVRAQAEVVVTMGGRTLWPEPWWTIAKQLREEEEAVSA